MLKSYVMLVVMPEITGIFLRRVKKQEGDVCEENKDILRAKNGKRLLMEKGDAE